MYHEWKQNQELSKRSPSLRSWSEEFWIPILGRIYRNLGCDQSIFWRYFLIHNKIKRECAIQGALPFLLKNRIDAITVLEGKRNSSKDVDRFTRIDHENVEVIGAGQISGWHVVIGVQEIEGIKENLGLLVPI